MKKEDPNLKNKKQMSFLPSGKTLSIQGYETVLALALDHDLDIGHSCGGMGSCTTCRVIVESPLKNLAPRNEVEEEMAEMKGFSEKERLACQLQPYSGLIVRIPKGKLCAP